MHLISLLFLREGCHLATDLNMSFVSDGIRQAGYRLWSFLNARLFMLFSKSGFLFFYVSQTSDHLH